MIKDARETITNPDDLDEKIKEHQNSWGLEIFGQHLYPSGS